MSKLTVVLEKVEKDENIPKAEEAEKEENLPKPVEELPVVQSEESVAQLLADEIVKVWTSAEDYQPLQWASKLTRTSPVVSVEPSLTGICTFRYEESDSNLFPDDTKDFKPIVDPKCDEYFAISKLPGNAKISEILTILPHTFQRNLMIWWVGLATKTNVINTGSHR